MLIVRVLSVVVWLCDLGLADMAIWFYCWFVVFHGLCDCMIAWFTVAYR